MMTHVRQVKPAHLLQFSVITHECKFLLVLVSFRTRVKLYFAAAAHSYFNPNF